MTRKTLAVWIGLAVVAVACGGDGGEAVDTAAYAAFRDQPTACGADQPEAATELEFDAPGNAEVTEPTRAILHTSCGRVVIEVDSALAPETVNSFVFLAEEGYFDGTVSHRVVPDFIIQAGDPTATGRGGPGYVLPDEYPDADFTYTTGTVAMANAGPGTVGSQFFLVLDDIVLPPEFPVFGRVVEGFDVLDRMTQVPLAPNPGDFQPSRPLETIYLERVEISR